MQQQIRQEQSAKQEAEAARASCMTTSQQLMQHHIDEGHTLREQLRQEQAGRVEAEEVASVKAAEMAAQIDQMHKSIEAERISTHKVIEAANCKAEEAAGTVEKMQLSYNAERQTATEATERQLNEMQQQIRQSKLQGRSRGCTCKLHDN